jgi:hypothetical protein
MNSLLITLVFLTRNLDFDRSQVPELLEQFKGRYEQELGVPLRFKIRYLGSSKCSKWEQDVGSSARANRVVLLSRVSKEAVHEARNSSFLSASSGARWAQVDDGGIEHEVCFGCVV